MYPGSGDDGPLHRPNTQHRTHFDFASISIRNDIAGRAPPTDSIDGHYLRHYLAIYVIAVTEAAAAVSVRE